jgi:hypothetical protein
MGSKAVIVFYVSALVAAVVGVDVLFLQHHFLERLLANVAIVVVFVSFYVAVLKRR